MKKNKVRWIFFFLFLWIFLKVNAIPAPWSAPSAAAGVESLVTSVSNSSTCPGGLDFIINGKLFPCVGGPNANPVESSCANGLTGIQLNNTLVCGTVGENIPAGDIRTNCTYGGFEFSFNEFTTIICYDDPDEQFKFDAINATLVKFATEISDLSLNISVSSTPIPIGSLVCTYGGTSYTFNFNGTFVTVNTCSLPPSYTVNSTSDGISAISSSTALSTTVKSFVNSSSVLFTNTATSISANALVTASDAVVLGGFSAISSFSGNNIVVKKFFGIPGFLDYVSTPTGLQLVSSITAYNVPYTGFNPMLFPDCPFITKVSDTLVCLAARTVSSLSNQTNAANVQYFPATPFQNQSAFSVASGFDLIFEANQPSIARIIYVNGETGNDIVNSGGQFDPFATIDRAVLAVPTSSFNDFYTILVSIDVYTIGNISFPPNTNLISYNRFKQTQLIGASNTTTITLSSAWSSFANDHVEAGISGFTIDANIIIDFTIMGPAGTFSDARFSFSESSLLGTVQSQGRGNTDLFHVHNTEFHDGYVGNCQNSHFEYSSSLSSVTFKDDNCYSNITYLVIYNVFGENSNLTIYQNTSDVHADVFVNAYDESAWAVFYGSSRLYVDTYTIPLNFYADPNVTIVYTFNSQGGRSCGLNTDYFSASCLNNIQILTEIRLRSRLTVSSNMTLIKLIYNTTAPNVILNDLATVTPNTFGMSTLGGILTFSINQFLLDAGSSSNSFIGNGLPNSNWTMKVPTDSSTASWACDTTTCKVNVLSSGFLNIYNVTDVECPTGGYITSYNGINRTTCNKFPFTPSNLGVSFMTDNFLNFVETGSGLSYLVSFIGQISFNDSAFSVFKDPSGSFKIFYRNPLVIAAGANVAVSQGTGSANYTISILKDVSFNTASITSGLYLDNASTLYFYNAAGTAFNGLLASPSLSANLSWYLPTTAGSVGNILALTGSGQLGWETLSSIIPIFLNVGTGASLVVTSNTTEYGIRGILGSSNIQSAVQGNDVVITLSNDILLNTVSVGTGVYLKNGSILYFFNSAGTFYASLSAGSLSSNLAWILPITAGNQNDVLKMGAGGQMAWSSLALVVNPGTGISVVINPGSNNITIANTGVLSVGEGSNIVVGGTSANPIVALAASPSITSLTVSGTTTTGGVILPSGNSIKFNDTTNNATITMNAPDGLTQSYNLVLPTTPGTSGQVLQANGDGSVQWIGIRRRIFESCANGSTLGASSTSFNTLIAGTACATGPASKFIAANSIKVGTVFDMIISGIISKNGGSRIQTRILINSTVIVTSSLIVTSGAISGVGFKATVRCLFQTIGVSGSVLCTGDFIHDQMTITEILSTTIPVTVDTTSVLFFDMQLAYDSSNTANFFTSSMTGMYIAL